MGYSLTLKELNIAPSCVSPPKRLILWGSHTSSLDLIDTQGTLHCEASGFPGLSISAPLHVHYQYAAYTQLQPTGLIKTSETRCLEIFKIHLDEMDGQASAWECVCPRVRALLLTQFVPLHSKSSIFLLSFKVITQTHLQTQEASLRQEDCPHPALLTNLCQV